MKYIAVIDVETTGFNASRADRIVEVGAMLITLEGDVVGEFASLVNPERDVGPTRIHGISAADIIAAPRFCEIAKALADFLSPASALAGHNVQFDVRFLRAEFQRLGVLMPDYPILDTLRLAGRRASLGETCAAYAVPFEGAAHAAICDARATAKLLMTLCGYALNLKTWFNENAFAPTSWFNGSLPARPPLTRDEARRRSTSSVSPCLEGDLAGKSVCFTGDSLCVFHGHFLTREIAFAWVESKGMIPANHVTKKLDLLVAADPYSLSGKAKQARRYGIPIIEEREFWKRLGINLDDEKHKVAE